MIPSNEMFEGPPITSDYFAAFNCFCGSFGLLGELAETFVLFLAGGNAF